MLCDNVLTVRWTVVAGVLLASIPLGAEPSISSLPAQPGLAGTPGVSEARASSIARVYRIQPDAESGRLVRRASKTSRRNPIAAREAAGTREVVQEGSRKQRLDLEALVRRAARRFDVEPELIHAVIRQESGYDPFAVSHKGAKGLMQLMPATAKRFGVKDVFDPAENVHGGVKYLRQLLDRYDGDRRLALAAYNAGEGAVDRFGGVPPYQETQDYVERIVGPSDSGIAADAEAIDPAEPVARRVVAAVENGTLLFEAH